MLPGRERRTLVIFIAMSILGGGNAVGVRFSNRELDPTWGATMRFAVAAAIALAIMWIRRLPMPRGKALLGAALYGLFSFGLAFGFAYYGLVEVQAGLGQTLLALVPLLTLLLAVVQGQERLHGWAVAGTVLSTAGIAVVSGLGLGESQPVLSLLAMIAAAACFAQAAVIVRRFPPVHPLVMNAVGMTTGVVFLFILTLVSGQDVTMPRRAATWLAIGFVAVVGSIVVFGMYVFVIQHWSASRASFTFVIVPVVTVVLSAWLDDEPIGSELLVGGLLVLLGVYLGALRPARASADKAAAHHHAAAAHRPH